MATLNSIAPALDVSATEGQFKTSINNLHGFVQACLGTDSNNLSIGGFLKNTVSKNANYTVVAADKGVTLKCTGTFTLNVQAVATLGDGFYFAVWNAGTGTITVDPNLGELIDGALTRTVLPGKLAVIYCDGTAHVTVDSVAQGAGSGLDADLLDGQHGSYYAAASSVMTKDMGLNNVGSIAFCYCSANVAPGGTVAGSQLVAGAVVEYASTTLVSGTGGVFSGTWRALGGHPYGGVASCRCFQRIS